MDRIRKVEENRRKALEKLRQRKLEKGLASGGSNSTIVTRPRLELTPEQKAIIERNRQRALDKQRQHQENNGTLRDASKPATTPAIRPSVKKSDYIEYDFSVMQDSFGGFIGEDTVGANQKKTLEEWRQEQEAKIVRDPAPPIDPENAPRCFECGSVEIDRQMYDVFKCRVCKRCKDLKPEKYSLLTKTECREDYFLTDPELKDESILKRIEKANPYSGTYSRMLLFVRYQVEEFAFKKWGGEEGLDKEWERRERLKVKRRDAKFEKNLREIRRKTRAEQITRRHRERNGGLKHEHEWSQPLDTGVEGVIKRRCTDCGMETEEFVI